MSGRQAGASRSGRPGKVAPASDGDGRRGGRRAALGPPAVTGSRDGHPRVHAAELSTALAGEPRTTRGFWVSPHVVPPPRQTMWCGRSRPVLLGARAGTGREAGCVTPAAGGTTTEQPRTAITPPRLRAHGPYRQFVESVRGGSATVEDTAVRPQRVPREREICGLPLRGRSVSPCPCLDRVTRLPAPPRPHTTGRSRRPGSPAVLPPRRRLPDEGTVVPGRDERFASEGRGPVKRVMTGPTTASRRT